MIHVPLRIRIDGGALAANWRWAAQASGQAACGAAVKADAYGVGARATVDRLLTQGCRDFFVATWAEADALEPWPPEVSVSVLHGVSEQDMPYAVASHARPVLNSLAQVERWRLTARPCDVMVDTGMHRLGLARTECAALKGLRVETLMSHLACADEDSGMNQRQRSAFLACAPGIGAKRLSLANSAGICLGPDFAFDLTRPGLALYGGVPRPEAEGAITQVVHLEAQIVQRRRIGPGDSVGYNATFRAERPHELAILNLGYADGYLRGFSGTGQALIHGRAAPVVGRVSMDLIALCVDEAPELREGDWVELDYRLPEASRQSGLSQYELLTCLGQRFVRCWS